LSGSRTRADARPSRLPPCREAGCTWIDRERRNGRGAWGFTCPYRSRRVRQHRRTRPEPLAGTAAAVSWRTPRSADCTWRRHASRLPHP